MGQKVNPIGFRVGVTRNWSSRWFASKKDFPEKLGQDTKIRTLIEKEMSMASISHVDIERASSRMRIIIYAARPGMIIGRKGAQIENLKDTIQNIVGNETKVLIDIKEITTPSLDAKIVADNVAFQLVKRISFRRAVKKAIQLHRDAGGKGIKIKCSGRLGGAEIARSEWYKWGKIPLQTIRADIDYGLSEAITTYGKIGVKVWIYKGEKFDTHLTSNVQEEKEGKSEQAREGVK